MREGSSPNLVTEWDGVRDTADSTSLCDEVSLFDTWPWALQGLKLKHLGPRQSVTLTLVTRRRALRQFCQAEEVTPTGL